MTKSTAPWTDEQVANLNAWQTCGWVHPFTCGRCRQNDYNDPSAEHALRATNEGWVCDGCDYTQDWAHEMMVGPLPPDPWNQPRRMRAKSPHLVWSYHGEPHDETEFCEQVGCLPVEE